MKRVLAVAVLIGAASFVAVAPGHAEPRSVVDEGWVPSWPVGQIGYQGVRFRDVLEYNEAVSVLRAKPDPGRGDFKSCTAIDVAPCSTSASIEFSATLQPCASSTQLDCIVEFGTIASGGTKTPARYTGVFPSAGLNDFPSNPSVGLPAGGPAGLWRVAETAGASSRVHLVRAVVAGSGEPGKKVTFSNFAANIAPVDVTRFPCGQALYEQTSGCRTGDFLDAPENHNGESGWSGYTDAYGSNDGFDCVLTGNLDPAENRADCATRKALNKEVRYYLTVRLSQAISGWLHGRMADPAISLDNISESPGAVTLSVAANPVSVPAVVIDKPFADLPTTLQDKYRATGGWPMTGGGYWGASGGGSDNVDPNNPLLRNRRSLPSAFGPDAIAEFEAWMPVVNDTAIADVSTWTVRTLGAGNLGAASGCVTDNAKLAGIVTTNATQYKAGTPEYNSTTQSLNYTVAAPHLMSSGETFKGAYSLVMRSDVARCIYKFSEAPISAKIEVIDTGAEVKTAVTAVSESGGWLTLTASGFTHSTPTIRSILSQEKPAATPSTVAPVTTAPAVQATVPTSVTAKRTSMKVKASLSASVVAKKAGLRVAKGGKIKLVVRTSSRQVCRVSGVSLRSMKKGICNVSVSVTQGKKRTTASIVVRVT